MKQDKPFQYMSVSTAVAAILGTVAVHAPVAYSAEAAADETELAEITVTGSRIVRRDFESSSPIVTVGAEMLESKGTQAVETTLNQLPQFVPSQTMFSSGDVQPSAFNNPGIVTLNLRGLGANRNLVLVDGRRTQPANAQLVVDINSIPAAAIDSVEIISGGASATYGADALGGVTNFKMKRNFQGMNLTAQTTLNEHGGGREGSISALIGGNFGEGRGNAMVGLSYTDRKVLKAADREFFTDGWRDPLTPGTDGLPYSQITFSATNPPSPAAWQALFGTGRNYAGETVYVNPDGTLFLNSAANPGINYTGPLGTDKFKRIAPGASNPGTIAANNLDAPLTTPLKRFSVFGNAHYDLTEHTSAFLQANMSSMQVDTLLNYAPATSQWNATIPVDGRAVPPQLASLLSSRTTPGATYGLSRNLDFAGPRSTQNNTDTYQMLAGLKGDIFGTGWNYEAFASHGKTALLTEMNGFPGLQNYRAVVTAANFGQNLNLNRAVGTPLTFDLKCTSGLPIFTQFTPSQNCIEAISTNMKHLTEMKQDIVEADVTGDLFMLPAGSVGSAWGATWRRNTYRWRPDDQLLRTSNQFPIGLFPTSKAAGQTSVKELYGELLVPVVKDIPGLKSLNLEVGGRYSDYNTAGTIWTYKALLDWSIVDSVRLRGGYQRANRAPNVSELYTGATTSVVPFSGGDPCMANTGNTTWGNHPGNTTNRAQVIQLCSEIINRSRGDVNQSPWHIGANYPNNIVGPFPFQFGFELANITGNSALANEEGKTWTVGLVLKSPFDMELLQNATLAIDWYQVKISNAIAPTSPFSVYEKCLNRNGDNPTYDINNSYCKLIARDQDGYRATVDTPYFNLGGIETSGIDVQLNWNFPVLIGRLNITTEVNFLDYYRDQVTPLDPFIESTGTFRSGGQYDYKTFTTVSYSQDKWSAGLRHRFLSSIDATDKATNPNTPVRGAGAYGTLDAFGSYTLSAKLSVRGGIDNLTDRQPPRTGINPGVTAASGLTNAQYYDVLGRRYFLSLDMKL